MGRKSRIKSCNKNRNFCSNESPNNSSVMTNAVDSNEIPGFFYDPETRTHYRITPENRDFYAQKHRLLNLTKLSNKRDTFENTKLSKKHLSSHAFPSVVINREYQNMSNEGFRQSVLRTRLKMLTEASRSAFPSNIFISLEECQMMIGIPSRGCLVEAWKTSNYGTDVVCHDVTKSNIDEENFKFISIMYHSKVADMCVVNLHDGMTLLLHVCNPLLPMFDDPNNRSTMHLRPIESLCNTSTPEDRYTLDSMTLSAEWDNQNLWSCAWNQASLEMAFGSEGKIIKMLCHNSRLSELYTPRENIFSLEYNKIGHSLYLGTNKGNLKCLDLRSNKLSFNVPLNRGLSYLKLLDSQDKILASCYDHKLFQVDLRMQKVLVEYAGHNNEYLKIPFSFSEANSFLCSPGQDRQTRIWNLNRGDLISSVPDVSSNSLNQNWSWFSEDWNFVKGSPETALLTISENNLITYKV